MIGLLSGGYTCHAATTAVWVPDQGDGTYRNPVLFADYSDPDAIRVGTDYYLVSSSFNCAPSLPVLQSKDLVNWRIINDALPGLEPADRARCGEPGSAAEDHRGCRAAAALGGRHGPMIRPPAA